MLAVGLLVALGATFCGGALASEPASGVPKTCPAGSVCASRDSALLQTGRGLAALKAAEGAAHEVGRVTSDCKQRLNVHEEHHSACVVTRGGRALLVWVPYGGAPGWDLPGGQKHSGEVACETAEREVCEETGFQVRAVKQLTHNVFECEVVRANVCTNAVDEGFLDKKWAFSWELGELQFRGNTWGDKQGLLETALGGGSMLLETGQHASARLGGRVTSDCSRRLNVYSKAHSACVVTRGNKALLVWVPYGSAPGWDLPGGHKKGSESACETAERETCEETGYQVRAVKKLSSNVFECEVVASNVCTSPVDEGFLRKQWAAREDLSGLQYRGGTWGDKKGFLKGALGSSGGSSGGSGGGSSSPQPDWLDVCGCKMCQDEGFSSTSQQCRAGSDTDVNEACACLQRSARPGEELRDACGCRPCDGEGWSSRAGACARGSDTDPGEACECQRRGGRAALVEVA